MMHSDYPRVGDNEHLQRLRRAIARWERGEIDSQTLKNVENSVVEEVLQEQEKAGLDIVTDGCIRWYCPFSFFARHLERVDINGLLRYYDTNFYFRQPVIRGEFSLTSPATLESAAFALERTSKTFKAVLTGPVTLAKYSIIETERYHSWVDLIGPYAEALNREIRALCDAGVGLIQIQEPELVHDADAFSHFRDAWSVLTKEKGTAKLGLALFWGPVSRIWSDLQNLQIDFVVIDMIYDKEIATVLEHDGSDVPVAFGIEDGRNTKTGHLESQLRVLEKVTRRVPEPVYITTSCGLELLPRDRAFRKLEHIGALSRVFHGGKE